MRKKRSELGHFFPLSNVYVNGLALGAMKWGLQRSVSLATNISKSHQILTPSHTCTHMHTRTHTHMHTLAPSTSPGTKLEAWEKDGRPLAPCPAPLHPAQGGDGRKLVPPSTPTLLPWRASQSASINHFWGREEARVKHRQMHWKECSSLK